MRIRVEVRGLLATLLLTAAPVIANDAVARRVLPKPAEMAWQALDWHPTLWDAVIAAHRSKKPVLLWAMNGHPLGHT